MKKSELNIKIITKYLLEKHDKEDKEMIDKIIPEDEKSRKEFEAYLQVWEKSEDVNDFEKVNVNDDWAKVRSRMSILPRSKRIPFRSFLLRIAAIIILAFGLTYFLIQVLDKSEVNNHEYYEIVSADEIKEVLLPDGSIVSLNKNGKLFRNSDFGKTNRDIILEGEAFFEVSKNKDLPFKIHSMNSVIEVLGTSFNVKTNTDLIVVSVITGKVAFYLNEDDEKKLELNPLNAGTLNINTKKLERQESFDPNLIAWYTKEFVFRNQALSDVCSIIADFYNLKLLQEEGIQNFESITITCSTQSIQNVISSINLSLKEDIELIATENNLIIRKQ